MNNKKSPIKVLKETYNRISNLVKDKSILTNIYYKSKYFILVIFYTIQMLNECLPLVCASLYINHKKKDRLEFLSKEETKKFKYKELDKFRKRFYQGINPFIYTGINLSLIFILYYLMS